MVIPIGSLGLGFLAGSLSILSPCVLPLLPLVLGPAVTAHRFGLPALVAGLVLSFVGIGLFVATVGFSIGLDGGVFRAISAVFLALMGVVLLSANMTHRFALAIGGVSNAGNRLVARLSPSGVSGQIILGLLLGAIWSPCVGPTLGAASMLAAQGRNLFGVTAVMIAFGLGAAVPLLILGSLSRHAFGKLLGPLAGVGKYGKIALGILSLLVAAMVLTGFDRVIESVLTRISPAWLVDLTSRF